MIIVTTKKGKKGGLKFDVHYEGGITPITNSDLGLASTKTYFNIMDEARANVGLNPLDPQKDIIEPYYSNWTSPITREEAMNTDMDWVDLVTRMGHFHDINVALNQGGENSTTYASVNYRSDESSLKGLSMNAVSARLNSEFKKGIVTLGTQSFLKFDRKKSTNKWAVVSDKFPGRIVYDPEDPTVYWNPQMADGHPTATLDNDYQLSTGENFSFRTTLYMDVNLKWIKGLSVRADASYGYGLAQSDYWLSGLITNTGNVDGNQGNKSKKTTKSQQYHAFAKYNREWTDHGLDIVTGIEANRSYTDNAVVAGKNLSGEFQEPKIIGKAPNSFPDGFQVDPKRKLKTLTLLTKKVDNPFWATKIKIKATTKTIKLIQQKVMVLPNFSKRELLDFASIFFATSFIFYLILLISS